jgi:hypothetical protein
MRKYSFILFGRTFLFFLLQAFPSQELSLQLVLHAILRLFGVALCTLLGNFRCEAKLFEFVAVDKFVNSCFSHFLLGDFVHVFVVLFKYLFHVLDFKNLIGNFVLGVMQRFDNISNILLVYFGFF